MYVSLTSQLVQGRLTRDLADETRENTEILRDISLPQETHDAAHVSLEEDADFKSLITNVFTQRKVSDMAEYWRDFLSITDVLVKNVYIGQLRQLSACHVAVDGSVRQQWAWDVAA